MILVSNGGSNLGRSEHGSEFLLAGTVDGVFLLRQNGAEWSVERHGLVGCSVGAVTALEDGTIFAATHGVGIARSVDGGYTWTWCNDGLTHFDFWAARAGKLQGRDSVFAGTMPAHLFVSVDGGGHWRELPGMRRVASVDQWCFPPPPRLGHVKDIALDGGRLLVGIEIGALLVSDDFGETFRELPVEPDPGECDMHRVLVDPANPARMVASVGLVGVVRSADGGASWTRNPVVPGMEYPDAIVMHPDRPDLLFMCVGVGWPPHWYKTGKAQGKIARSRDGGATWERLLGGLPNGQRALFSALTMEVRADGFGLYAADTDGQVWESLDEGDTWTMIADIAPVSKGEFYRGLAKDRRKLATVDDVTVNAASAQRFAEAGALSDDVTTAR